MIETFKIKDYLFSLVEKYSKPEFLLTDPIQFCHRYNKREDIEIVGLISALFSYGNVSSICKFLDKLLENLGSFPSQSILDFSNLSFSKTNFKAYRFQTKEDVFEFLVVIGELWKSKKTFQTYFKTEDELNSGILNFQREFWKQYQKLFFKKPSNGLQFLIGVGNKNSAHKRLWMFLRWMIRKEFPDFGIYSQLKPKDLIYPLDTHILHFSDIYNVSKRKTVDYKKALEITNWFKNYSSDDPLLFDFPISRMGILKEWK